MWIARSSIAALLAVSAAPAVAQVQQVTPNYKVVERGHSIKLDNFGSYDPTCKPIGQTTINLTSAPQGGGTVETEQGLAYPTFNVNNVRFQCDKRRLPAALLYYRAGPNFTGTDTFTVEVVFGSGEARQLRYTVYVR